MMHTPIPKIAGHQTILGKKALLQNLVLYR